MRKSLKYVIFIFCLFFSVQMLNAQPLPPGGGHGQTGDQEPAGGGAPIGSGIATLLVLGSAYAGKKFFGNSEE